MFIGDGVDVMVNVGLKVTNEFNGSSPLNDASVVVKVRNNDAGGALPVEPPSDKFIDSPKCTI